ncbi:MAG: phosphoribosylglycinamide formyltransferase [Candidatus Omnitrophota bacterium]|nr:phosphoribosylglycinamide formyltransferase [Candidatus Omnitrophota bacterium]
MKIAVLVSGNGSNLQALIDAEKKGNLAGGKIAVVISDNPDAFAVTRARKIGIETIVLKKQDFKSREDFDTELIRKLRDRKIELVVLAGFMRILTDAFIEEYKNRILNIHPALLPSFKGAHGIKDAFKSGTKVTGVTVHFVEKEVDSGPIILQSSVCIREEDTEADLEEKIHKEEHKLYPEAVRLFVEGKLKIEGRKVKIM